MAWCLLQPTIVRRLILIIASIALFPGLAFAQDSAPQDPAEELFISKGCLGCHAFGRKVVGPDLKDAHVRRDRAWLVKMIVDPGEMLKTDAIAKKLLQEYGAPMPDQGVTAQEAEMMIDLIARCSTETCEFKVAAFEAASTEAADIEVGRKLFVGETGLKNGAPACISCHSAPNINTLISGGTMALDLANLRFGDEALDGFLKAPASLMTPIFRDHPLTDEERASLRAFLLSPPGPKADTLPVHLVAVLGTLLCFLILNFFWRSRLRGVRKPLVQSSRGV